MKQAESIIISDQSALHALLHGDLQKRIAGHDAKRNPLPSCAHTKEGFAAFNVDHPLYGGKPITVLAGDRSRRRRADGVICRCIEANVPASAFFELREGLYMARPELVFVRMANYVNANRLVEIGENLCARYYLDPLSGEIKTRSEPLTTPERLASFAAGSTVRGSSKAAREARFVIGNSASPFETKMAMQFCLPMHRGGFALPFTRMNYDVTVGRAGAVATQEFYSVDLADPQSKCGVEYDGEEYHQDASRDKLRRNELQALGWHVFPIDKSVLFSPEATERAARQIARHLHRRLRKPSQWEQRFAALREDLGLPFRAPLR